MKIHFALHAVIATLLTAVFLVVLTNLVINKPSQDQHSTFTIYSPAKPPPVFDRWLAHKQKDEPTSGRITLGR